MTSLFALIVWVLSYQNEVRIANGSYWEINLLGYLVSLLTVTVNSLLIQATIQTTQLEKWSTVTKHNVRLATKITICQFACSALLQFVTTCVFLKNYLGPGGLIYNQTLVFITSTLLPPIILALAPQYQLARFRRHIIRKRNTSVLTQQQVQIVFENPSFPITTHYASLLQTVLICAFYAPLIPIGVILVMVRVFLLYWQTKYDLLFRSSVKSQQSNILSLSMTEVIEWVLVLYTVFYLFYSRLPTSSLNYWWSSTSITWLFLLLLSGQSMLFSRWN